LSFDASQEACGKLDELYKILIAPTTFFVLIDYTMAASFGRLALENPELFRTVIDPTATSLAFFVPVGSAMFHLGALGISLFLFALSALSKGRIGLLGRLFSLWALLFVLVYITSPYVPVFASRFIPSDWIPSITTSQLLILTAVVSLMLACYLVVKARKQSGGTNTKWPKLFPRKVPVKSIATVMAVLVIGFAIGAETVSLLRTGKEVEKVTLPTLTVSQELSGESYIKSIRDIISEAHRMTLESGNKTLACSRGQISKTELLDFYRRERSNSLILLERAVGLHPPTDYSEAHFHIVRSLSILSITYTMGIDSIVDSNWSLMAEASVLNDEATFEQQKFYFMMERLGQKLE